MKDGQIGAGRVFQTDTGRENVARGPSIGRNAQDSGAATLLYWIGWKFSVVLKDVWKIRLEI